MLGTDHPDLPISHPRKLLSIARSSSCSPKGETEGNLVLSPIDLSFGSKWRIITRPRLNRSSPGARC